MLSHSKSSYNLESFVIIDLAWHIGRDELEEPSKENHTLQGEIPAHKNTQQSNKPVICNNLLFFILSPDLKNKT